MSSRNASDPEPTYKVRSLSHQTLGGKEVVPDYVRRIAPKELVDTVLSARAELLAEQDSPPCELARALHRRLSQIDLLGDPVTHDVCIKIEDEILRSGARRSFIEGATLTWYPNPSSVLRKAEVILGWEGVETSWVAKQLQSCLDATLLRSPKVTLAEKLSSAELRKSDLARVPKQSRKRRRERGLRGRVWTTDDLYPEAPEFTYAKLQGQWPDYRSLVEKIAELQGSIALRALQFGNLIAVEATTAGYAIVPPKHWVEPTSTDRSIKEMSFLFTRDLPKSWFFSKARLHSLATAQLTEWRAHFRDRGQRLSRQQGIDLLVDRLGLTENAAVSAWRDSNATIGNGVGSISMEMRVSENEIRALE